MKTLKQTSLKLLLLIIFLIVNSTFSQNLEQKIDAMASEAYPENGPGVSILIAKDGKAIYQKAFGNASLELNVPMTTDNVFEIGSITKQFTAVAILMLEEKGKLKLNDNITNYLPEYPTNGNAITIHNLLNHTSGIRGRTPVSNKKLMAMDMEVEELIDYIKKQPLKFNSGEQFSYSNSGYIILGRIIEIITGKSNRFSSKLYHFTRRKL